MRRLTMIAATASLLCCGPQPPTKGALGFELLVSRAVSDKVGSLQVALLAKGKSYDCTQVQRNCLSAQVGHDKLVKLTDSDGKQHDALIFPLSLSDGGLQNLSVTGIPVGQDFAVVVEALTRDNPPNLYGSSCSYVTEIVPQANPPLVAATITPFAAGSGADAGYKACDPRFEK